MKSFHYTIIVFNFLPLSRKFIVFFFRLSFSRNVHASERNRHLNGVIRNLRYLFIPLNIRFADIDLLSFPFSIAARKNKYPVDSRRAIDKREL